ncbi:cell division protein ZapE [Pseudolysinimonas yzui]|uniref:Cell division protein ZapE n=1 Tax=Pseudolysinimonas yzui TaxID=2708254 RepID=A0A8J3M2P6_9MICO|nr:cell division protein ZapE [Pseudolysinimonas yzui]GHF08502.1 cell division protein ZapE [Pseudolysinimonas yzui]
MTSSFASLLDRAPTMSGDEIAASLVPPRQFDDATLENYRPDPDYPSQAQAVERVRAFAAAWKGGGGGLFRKKGPELKPGLYLDGGFGVGKTHLLAALWKLAPGRKYFGTFIEYTALVGALGYQATVKLLTGATFVAIDEFELDDPGDTMMMTRLLGELAESGTRIAATSNTPPNALGEGRFAAVDFLREIHALAARFDILRIDGLDYRRRDLEGHAVGFDDDAALEAAAAAIPGAVTIDDFDAVLRHLATVHPSRYVKLVDGLSAIGLRGVHVLQDQTDALRFVAAVDRLYDDQVRVLSTGVPLDQVFGDDMLAGGYRKKYLRAISRLIALTSGAPE